MHPESMSAARGRRPNRPGKSEEETRRTVEAGGAMELLIEQVRYLRALTAMLTIFPRRRSSLSAMGKLVWRTTATSLKPAFSMVLK